MSQRYKLTVAYDGTNYAGWQVQPGEITIQSELERAGRELTGEPSRMHCSGRTDAGVHAEGQVVHFDVEKDVDARRLVPGFNALLQPDIRVLHIEKADPEFHARKSATGKEYRYFIYNGEVVPPAIRLYRYQVRGALDEGLMGRAAKHLEGRHDFLAFSANPNREVEDSTRSLFSLRVERTGPEILVVARGEGFLYKMVRSLAGFLVRVGAGELPPEAAVEILDSRERTARVPTAPPEGLFLWEVYYGEVPAAREEG